MENLERKFKKEPIDYLLENELLKREVAELRAYIQKEPDRIDVPLCDWHELQWYRKHFGWLGQLRGNK